MISDKKVFITGSNGFVGQCLQQYLKLYNISFLAGVRQQQNDHEIEYGDLDSTTDWTSHLNNIDCIIHLAGRAHKLNDPSADPLAEFRKNNTDVTTHLALEAKKSGVRQFIFMSTIKVNGEATTDKPFRSRDIPHPEDPYAISKWETEQKLLQLHEPGVFDVTIIRPPLIYGPGAKGNLALLEKIVRWPIPLPFKSTNNKRSLVSVLNLSDLLLKCIRNPKASGQIFLVSDQNSYSLTDILTQIAQAQNQRVFLFSFPIRILIFIFKNIGLSKMNDRLFSNLEVEISHTTQTLNWQPKYNFQDTFRN